MGRLFWKFFAAILFAQIAATLGAGAVFWLHAKGRDNQSTAIDTSHPAAERVEAAALMLRYGGVDALRDLLGRQRGPVSVVALDETGHELLARPVTPRQRAAAEAALERGQTDTNVLRVPGADGHSYLLFMPPHPEPPPVGLGPLASGMGGPTHPMPDHGPRLHIMPMLAALCASLVVAVLLALYFSRRIRALRHAFDAAAAGDLAPRFAALGKQGGDELTDLSRDFDRMSGRLRALMDGQRRLLHDVSHELRSPLARLQAAIGLAHQQPDKTAASLQRIERESVRMDKLVDELLTLSRLEAQTTPPLDEEIGVMELADALTEDAGFEAEQAGKRLTVSGSALVQVRGSGDLLLRAIENVVRNAVKHSPEGGTVELALAVKPGAVCLTVLDRGPGIAPGDLEHVFQPFFRSQPQSNNVDGHGLGLAIAHRVITAHGGTIAARNREGGGLAVDIVLPLAR